ncbi:MAG: carboxypeptidase regulatory-like domain-containing protein, partial [Acidobacteriaceae bacterium]
MRWAGLAVLLCGLAAWGQAYTPVTVVVTDPSGAGVSGAEILVTPGSPSGDRLITDEHGRAQLGMPAGEYKLHIAAQGFMTADQKLSVADKAQTVNVTLQPGKPTSGGVVNPGATPLQPSAVPLESTVEKPHAESTSEAAPGTTLVIEGMDGQRGVFTTATLKEYPHQTVTIFDHHTNAKETYSGVPLMELLAHLGVPHGKELMGKALGNYVVATGSDGYK